MTRFYMHDGGDLESRIIAARLREANTGLLKTARRVRRDKTWRKIARAGATFLAFIVVCILIAFFWIATGK